LLLLKSKGKAIFSPTVYKAVEQYLQHIYDYDVQMDSIKVGRWSTIRTHMNWFKRFVNAEYRLDNYTAKALMDYQRFRREKGAKDVTIANEQSTINHFCKRAYDEGLHNITKYAFPKIKQRGEDTASIRRATFNDDEYKACYKELQTWCSKASKEKAAARLNEAALGSDERLFNRDLCRQWFLMQAITMMRNGELFGLKWKNVIIDAEMRRQKTVFVRISKKKSIRTYTYKLLEKAEANSNAVAESKFGLGVYRTGDKE